MVDGFPEIDEQIRAHVRDDWESEVPADSAALEQFVRDIRGIIVSSPAESDCRSVSEGLGVAFDECGVPYELITDGLYDDDAGELVPHSWIVLRRSQPRIIDGTAEQFNDPALGDVGIVAPDHEAWERYS